jgi:hypothetical protein
VVTIESPPASSGADGASLTPIMLAEDEEEARKSTSLSPDGFYDLIACCYEEYALPILLQIIK